MMNTLTDSFTEADETIVSFNTPDFGITIDALIADPASLFEDVRARIEIDTDLPNADLGSFVDGFF